MASIQEVATAVENGKVKLIEGLVTEALEAGINPNEILNEGMIAAMGVVGAKFQANEIFVPEMLVAAKTLKKGVEVLKPHLAGDSVGALGTYIIGTVKGDLHDIGKNLVALMIESAGFRVVDLGIDIPAETFIEAVNNEPNVKIVAASALLTTTMDSLRTVVTSLIAAGVKEKGIKIMVGGAPITQAFADEIGADAYTPDAGAAAVKAVELVS
ncbi:MAG: corrinoid protein [Oscillospiraceae bacterium]|jgi:corrinoid protein of di/trimethylamine methyltransferase|nr:corrinoid protein [Oscillospiraceae bacterium]